MPRRSPAQCVSATGGLRGCSSGGVSSASSATTYVLRRSRLTSRRSSGTVRAAVTLLLYVSPHCFSHSTYLVSDSDLAWTSRTHQDCSYRSETETPAIVRLQHQCHRFWPHHFQASAITSPSRAMRIGYVEKTRKAQLGEKTLIASKWIIIFPLFVAFPL